PSATSLLSHTTLFRSVVLGFENVACKQPRRPWRPAELNRALDLAEAIHTTTASVPDELALQPLYVDLPPLLTGWSGVPEDWPVRDRKSTRLNSSHSQI